MATLADSPGYNVQLIQHGAWTIGIYTFYRKDSRTFDSKEWLKTAQKCQISNGQVAPNRL